MKIFSTVWSSNKSHVDGFAPLSKIVSIYREQKQIHDPIYFLILDGWQFFQHLQKELMEKNCFLIDATVIKDEYQHKYEALFHILRKKHGGGAEFLMNNILRWFVMNHFADNSDFLHTDCDLILNANTVDVQYSESIYMGSTCFVYIKNSKNLQDIYSETINQLIHNKSFIQNMQNLCSDELWKWGQGHVKNISEVHEEILFYWMLRLFNLDWSDPRDDMIYVPFMQNLIPEYNICPQILTPSNNKYTFINKRHYINNKPFAYMHYQQNMRMLLGLYTIQQLMGIPDKYKYAPEMIHFYTAINQINSNDTRYLETEFNFRKNNQKNNNTIDILLLSLVEYITKNQIKISSHPSMWNQGGIQPANLTSVLDFEYTGWGSILNKDFWFAENMFE